MVLKPKIDQELVKINEAVIQMTEKVEEAIVASVEAIKSKDPQLARKIVDDGDVIDEMDEAISEACYRFMATQSPMIGDLRYCISIMKMVTDLERIGDHCEDIAKYAIRLEKEDLYKELIDLPRMAEMAANMVVNSISAFLNRDLKKARKVWRADEEVDELYRMIHEEQMDMVVSRPEHARQAMIFAFIAAHLERIADYATNICEETVFSLEGDYLME